MAHAAGGVLRKLFLYFIATTGLQPAPVYAQTSGDLSSPDTWRTKEYLAQWGLDAINAADAYALDLDGSGVKIGVADTGIDPNHPEFSGRIGGGYDYLDNTATLTDSYGHGTMVASVIAANRDGVGMHGVAPGATVYSARILDEDDSFSQFNRPYMAAAWDDLISQGVRIINNSWGSSGTSITDESAEYWLTLQPNLIAAARRAVSADTLMIFGTGNNGAADPLSPAGLPYYVPDLESGWLAVAAIAPAYMPEWSNECGVAMNWCLAAPGGSDGWAWDSAVGAWVWVNDRDDILVANSGGGYSREWGTSLAAPHVAGAAALVAQRFPYMTMEQVRQVLLGTALDVGDPGVDEVFGYGILDVGKAVKGPGKFDWGDFRVTFDQGTSTWGNDITGAGGLIKSGSGSLELTGHSTYSGQTHVNGGQLMVSGSIASPTFVGANGVLSGNGTIIGDLDSQGMVAPGVPQQGGTLSVEGDYVQHQSGSLFVDVAAPGRLDVSGQAHIDGARVDVALKPGDYQGDQRYTILSTGDAISGRYDELCQCFAFLNVALSYDPQNVYLDVARNGLAFGDVGTSHNQRSVGAAIESMQGVAAVGDSNTTLFDRVLLMDASTARATFDSLSGELHPSVASALIDDSRYTRDAITSRLRTAFRQGATQPSLVAQNGSVKLNTRNTAFTAMPETSTWGQVYGAWGHMSSGSTAQLDRSSSGFFVGADTSVGDSWRAGLMGGFGSSTFRVDNRQSSASVDSYTLAAYTGAQYGATSLRFGAGHTWHDVDAKRSVPFLSERADSDYHARTAQLFGEAAYQFDLYGAQLEPFAQLAYVHLHTDGFDEGGAVGLRARSANHDTTFSTLGLRTETVLGTTEKSALTAHAMMGWQHAFGALSPKSTFSLSGGSPFTIEGVPLARDALVLDAGLSVAAGDTLNISFSYIGQLAQNSTNQTVRGDLVWRF
ncbi:Subtilase-type serine protease [Bordetella tumbae]|uniref:autotransporter domain-containing protein n=1 Tax=Bordetella tumbae TaxID=1649139 RepID=UPI0039EF1369